MGYELRIKEIICSYLNNSSIEASFSHQCITTNLA
uniref:Uncharacterized protein n=1 Tax=Arundo donax TaxID=35708 RepID=A0A0A9C6L2_ARUDO